MRENREISCTSWSTDQDRSAKAINQKAGVNVQEKSDCAVIPMNQPNKEGRPSAEVGEGRAQTEGDGLWKRRGRGPLGKRSAFPTFPQPRRLPGGSYDRCVREPKPGESLIIRGLKMGGRSRRVRQPCDRNVIEDIVS